MPKDQQKTRRSAQGSGSRSTATSQPRSVVNSQSGRTTHSQVHSAVSSRFQPLPNRAPDGSDNHSHYLVVDQPVTRVVNGEDYPLAHSAIPAAGSKAPTDGAFNNAHHVVFNQPVFVEGVHLKEKDSVGLLAQSIIPGAQFDSSERYPPPSCHPGTRLDISEKLVSWVRDLVRKHKIVWLHGPAGVGKSAVIQTLVEAEASSPTSILGATLFLSKPNKRDDPQRVFLTIAYQLAVKYPAYRAYVVELLMVDPLLVRKSLVEQFKWLVVKPFAENKLQGGTHETVLITLDGLDECNGEWAQREIIFLIGKFCLEHPSAPLIWIIASRPEPEIRTAFSHHNVRGAYMEIDMPVDADQACRDVERYLRDSFVEIKEKYSNSFSPAKQWPTETDFTKIAKRSSGLFAFANTVTRFTGDTEYANPVTQLQKVLDVLESASSPAADDAPFAALDTLYTLILSTVHPKVLPITRRLLLVKNMSWSFTTACNLLSINQAEAYGALRKLHSVLCIPQPGEASNSAIKVFHKSFDDFLESPSRSSLFWLNPRELESMMTSMYVRILLEAHDTAKSLVHPSNIKISWTDGGSVKEQQESFFAEAFTFVLEAPLDKANGFDELRYFFQDIDYGSWEFIHPFADAPSLVGSILTSPLMPRFKEWGVIKTAPIQSLNFDSISLDKPISVLRGRTGSVDDQSNIGESIAKVVFPPHLRADKIAFWCEQRVYPNLGGGTYWGGRIRRHLAGPPPPPPVTVLGKGNKGLLIVGVDDPGDPFICMVRYKLS